jgi:hypothetical protein
VRIVKFFTALLPRRVVLHDYSHFTSKTVDKPNNTSVQWIQTIAVLLLFSKGTELHATHRPSHLLFRHDLSQHWKKKRIRSIFNDESTESFICLTFHSLLFSVFSIHLLFNGIDACIGHTCNTTRVQHDTVTPCTSSYSVYYYISSPIPSATRATTHTIT